MKDYVSSLLSLRKGLGWIPSTAKKLINNMRIKQNTCSKQKH